jgi:general secretion pathway protein A
MYQNFFGFKEKPFKLVPNPTYLFLSKSHEEALAHLTYAITQGDGFVKITGEVGTGKTTLCRAFLENLDETTEAAYIFNPKLNSVQLLKAINDEFGIPSGADSIKALIDTLNDFLMSQKAQGRKVVLLIDEAQNLSPAVLEQIRLLSNLETTRSKLLQIILVGQPELDQILNSKDLRQLGQRINLSCRLMPLSGQETREYIQHRINIASWKARVRFPNSASRIVYNYSNGIPRLINIVCDRTLLMAFGAGQDKISGKTVKTAVKEIGDTDRQMSNRFFHGKKAALLLSIACLFLIWVIITPPDIINTVASVKVLESKKRVVVQKMPPEPEIIKPEIPAQPPAREVIAVAPDPEISTPPPPPGPVIAPAEPEKIWVNDPAAPKDVQDFIGLLNGLEPRKTRYNAFKAVVDLWDIAGGINPELNSATDHQLFFRLAAKQSGLLTQRIVCDLDLIKTINLPTILEFLPDESRDPVYLTVSRLENDRVTLIGDGSGRGITIEPEILNRYWTGVTYVPWKNFLVFTGEIPNYATKDDILTLKKLMKDIGFTQLDFSPIYDEETRRTVEEIQQKHGLLVDGVVGPLTKIVLYNEIESLFKPHILAESTQAADPSQTRAKALETGL